MLTPGGGSRAQREQPLGVAGLSLFLSVFRVEMIDHDRLVIFSGVSTPKPARHGGLDRLFSKLAALEPGKNLPSHRQGRSLCLSPLLSAKSTPV